MLTAAQNEALTRVGPGTPLGNLLRRYWMPVAASIELRGASVKAVRILGESLTLFRDPDGRLGLVDERCAHRLMTLEHGIPERGGMRCAYHGWVFDRTGQCVEQPGEPANSTFKDRIRIKAYPVEECGGLVFAYLGPSPAPALPHWDRLEAKRGYRTIGVHRVKANWLQCVENGPDLHHVPIAHGPYYRYYLEKNGITDPADIRQQLASAFSRRYIKTGYDRTELGMASRAVYEGTDEAHPLWSVGQQIVFPHMSGVTVRHAGIIDTFVHFRVPIDDTATITYSYHVFEPHEKVALPVQAEIPLYEMKTHFDDGRLTTDVIQAYDLLCMEGQGEIVDRTRENLGSTDQGIILLRSMLFEQMERVRQGEDPLNVFRNPAQAAHIVIPAADTGTGVNSFGAVPTYIPGFSTAGMVFGPCVDVIEDLARKSCEVASAA